MGTKAFLGDENGNLKALQIVNLEWQFGADGRLAQFTQVGGSEREIPCEMAFLEMGFVHPQHEELLQQLKIELDDCGNVIATEKAFSTNVAKVFTTGDMRIGQFLVVWAVSEGRECARKVDQFLMGRSMLESKDQASVLALI